MTFSRLLDQTVTVVTVTPTGPADRYGNPTEQTSTTTVQGRVQQAVTTERIGAGDLVVTHDVLFLEPSVAVTAQSRFVIDGRMYSVDGEPNAVHGGSGVHHYEVPLRIVEG